MKKILGSLSGLTLLMALAGCCANNVCNCGDDALADALFFQINYTSHRQYNGSTLASFSARDVDTIRIYRTNRPPTTGNSTGFVQTTDVVTIARRAIPKPGFPGDTIIAAETDIANTSGGTTTLRDQDLLVINNASPFASTSTTKLSGYDYRVEVVSNAAGRRTPLATYYISNINLAGRYDANGCCTCYQNTGKNYFLSYRVFTGSVVDAGDSAGVRRVVRLPFVPR